MISQQKFNRLERLVRLLGERPSRYMLESRKQTAALGNYVTAVRECDAARQSLTSKPEDLETRAAFHRAQKSLEIAREELQRITENQRRRLPA
jgi:hypothetical protein